ncbi:HAD family hydrolase [Salirhabdus salicampi]|uniref:HAD family hydrolase n=1 Tax=Salirhabdus salicampi TaxID=476102 RepID=UPI0020C54BAB|nr:HAD family hydrolase [Salirhabdus salicampi]MCP8617904.1 HAD family hydrolase [Salirhabdus salicampi]
MLQQFIAKTDVIIFDLDGTLYEGEKHFSLLAENLKKRLPEQHRKSFDYIYAEVLAGNHPLSIGKIYDAKEDLIWTWDPFTEKLVEARNWDNETVEVENVPNTLGVNEFDFERWIPLGDGWWPPHTIARHFGLSSKGTQDAYHETKEQMANLEGFLHPTPGLQEFLASLSTEKDLVLMTNSDAEDVERLLQFLGLHKFFTDIVPSALKPVKTKPYFEEVIKRYDVRPEQVLSIGDNFMNEIAPALQLGMYAAWLTKETQHPVQDEKFTMFPSLANMKIKS